MEKKTIKFEDIANVCIDGTLCTIKPAVKVGGKLYTEFKKDKDGIASAACNGIPEVLLEDLEIELLTVVGLKSGTTNWIPTTLTDLNDFKSVRKAILNDRNYTDISNDVYMTSHGAVQRTTIIDGVKYVVRKNKRLEKLDNYWLGFAGKKQDSEWFDFGPEVKTAEDLIIKVYGLKKKEQK